MRRVFELLKSKAWSSWLGPTFATVGVGGIIINHGIFTKAADSTLPGRSLTESIDTVMPNKPVLALVEEPNTLSHSFLIRQSCALSYESASKLYTHIYLALEDYSCKYSKVLSELTTIYEETSPDTILFMDDDFQMRFVSLQKDAEELKTTVNELEITSQFAKKVLDLNAEVSYIGGAEFVSNQASERAYSIEKYIAKLIQDLRLKEYDLAKAKCGHIERSKKAFSAEQSPPVTDELQEPALIQGVGKDTNFDIMNSRED